MLYILRNQTLHTEVYEEYLKFMTAIFELDGAIYSAKTKHFVMQFYH